jgi:hypothetical protein
MAHVASQEDHRTDSTSSHTPEQKRTAKRGERYILVMYQHPRDSSGLGEIGYELAGHLRTLLGETIRVGRPGLEIDLWIESSGGDADAAYKIALLLRSKCDVLRVVIPDMAKSAATLIALAADEVYMSPAAELGPLDAQIQHPDREDKGISALDVAGALDELAKIGLSVVNTAGPRTIRVTGLPRRDVFPQLLKYANDLMNPVASKLDPSLIHNAANGLKVAEKYAENLIRRFVKNPSPDRAARLRELPHKLVTSYPSHGYVIDIDEAKELGINALPMAEYDFEAVACRLHRVFEATFGATGASVINLVHHERVSSLAPEESDG